VSISPRPAHESRPQPIRIALVTLSDTRTLATDTSGNWLAQAIVDAGHRVVERTLLSDDRYQLRAKLSAWIADAQVDVVICSGGTGFTGRDCTIEALQPLLDKEMPGFGEVFRHLSFAEIGSSSLQSRALAGVANGTFVFALPGSSGAVRLAWNELIALQLNSTTKPCNLVAIMPRLLER
jgi:molybdopterin adenylyltransferase